MKKSGIKKPLELARALVAVMLALVCAALLIGCGGGSGSTTSGSTPPPSEPEADEPASLTQEAIDYWNGDWFGWWQWENATGIAADSSGGYWDCQARFSTDADGSGSVTIWDNDWSIAEDSSIAEINYVITPTGGANGTLTSSSGLIINDSAAAAGVWVLDSGAMGADNFIVIKGHYVEPDDSSTSLDYTIYLRPWGTSWDDAPVDPPSNLDWYRAAIEAGQPMPDVIGE